MSQYLLKVVEISFPHAHSSNVTSFRTIVPFLASIFFSHVAYIPVSYPTSHSALEPLPGTGSLTLASVEQQPRQVQQVPHLEQEEPSSPIIEAQGWVRNIDGSVELVAVAPTGTASSTSTQASCPSMAPAL